MNLKDFVTKLKSLNSVKKSRKKKIELNEEQIKMLANMLSYGAVIGFLQFWENREKEFYKELSKMRF